MSVLDNLTVTRAAAFRQPAWMGLGNVFDKPVTQFSEMLRLSTLDQMHITEETLSASGGDARFIVPIKALVMEDVTTAERKVVGVVGAERTLIKPDEAFGFLENLIPGLAWEIAGTTKDDRVVFGALRWDRESKPGNGDANIQHYLVVAFAFDGTMPLRFFVTSIRPECMNTLTMGIKGAIQQFVVRQTKNARDRMAVQAAAFKKANTYVDAWDAAISEMIGKEITDKQFENLIGHFYKKPETDTKGSMTKWEDKRDAHFAMWNADHNANVRNSAFGAWNVLTEVQQWGRQMREGKAGSEAFYLSGAGLDTLTEKFRTDAMARVRHVAGLAAI
jgi:phage/plasmid-like protein (TIGR03299 family)